MERNVLGSWSGGKDSCFACMQAIQQGMTIRVLLNVLNEEGRISRSHGIPAPVLQAQAAAAGLPIKMIASSWEEYEHHFTTALKALRDEFDLNAAVFGDIDLQPHRDWEEKVCAAAGLQAFLPLWKQDRKALVAQMLEAGIHTRIVSCNTAMGSSYIGRVLTAGLVEELEHIGIDPCGENGEFHTLVVDCPLFIKPISVAIANPVLHNDYWFSEIRLVE